MFDPLMAVGHPLYRRGARLISFCSFLVHLTGSVVRNAGRVLGLQLELISFQIYFTCIQALPIVFFLSLFAVVAFISQADNYIGKSEASAFIAELFVIVMIREVVPLLTALIVIGRSGTAIAAELASMVANEEINAMRVMRIDPLYYLVFPRVIGLILSTVCLTLTFSLLGLFFSALIGFYLEGIAPGAFLEGVVRYLPGLDLVWNLIKSAVFGLIIALISTFCGLSARGATTEIPQVTTHAVIASVLWCFVFSSLWTVFIY